MTARPSFVRDFQFRFANDPGDGLTLEGYAAVFDSPTTISERGRTFTERVARGAFKRTLQGRVPVLQFDHGSHPSIGSVPIGSITEIREDTKGLFVKARLFDNSLVAPVRDAISGGAIRGMSFRFEAIHDKWSNDRSERVLTEVRCPECGPVVFPAYKGTSVAVRDQEGHSMTTKAQRQARAAACLARRAPTGGVGTKEERIAQARALTAGTSTKAVTPEMRARWERERQRKIGVILAQNEDRGSSSPWLSDADHDRLNPKSIYKAAPTRAQRRRRLQRQAKGLLERHGRGRPYGQGWPSP